MLTALKDREQVDDHTNVLNRLSPVGFTLNSITDYLEDTYLRSFQAAALDRKMEDLSTVFFEALYWKAALTRSLQFAQEKYGTDPRSRVELYTPYEKRVRNQIDLLDEKVTKVLTYRGQSVRDILNEDGTGLGFPPLYPQGDTADVLHGLVGSGYIPKLTIGKETYHGFHYIGFALESTDEPGSFIPWMSGTVRRDADDRIIASVETPKEPEDRVVELLVEAYSPTMFYQDDWEINELPCNGRQNSLGSNLDELIFSGNVQLVWDTSLDFEDTQYAIELYHLHSQTSLYDSSASDYIAYKASGEIEDSKTNMAGYYVQFKCTFSCNTDGPNDEPNDGPNEAPKVCSGSSFRWALVDCGCPEGLLLEQNCTVESPRTARGAVCIPEPSASPSVAPSQSPTGTPSNQPTMSQFPSQTPSESMEPSYSLKPSYTPTLSTQPTISIAPTSSPEPTMTTSPTSAPSKVRPKKPRSRLNAGGTSGVAIGCVVVGGVLVYAWLKWSDERTYSA